MRWPLWGLAIYLTSIPVDYLLSLAGFSTQGLASIGQMCLVLVILASLLRSRSAKPVSSPLKKPHKRCMRSRGLQEIPENRVVMAGQVPSPGIFQRAVSRPVRGVYGAIIAFVAVALMSAMVAALRGDWSVSTLYAMGILGAIALIPFCFCTLVRDLRQIRFVIIMIALSSVLSAGIGVLEYGGFLQTNRTDRYAEDQRGSAGEYQAQVDRSLGSAERFTGPTTNPNGFGGLLFFGICPLFYLLLELGSLLRRLLAGAALALCCSCLLLTMSRTYIVVTLFFMILMAYYGWRHGRQQRWVYLLVGGFMAGGFVMLLMRSGAIADRVIYLTQSGNDISVTAREQIFLSGLQAFLGNPLLGVGPMSFRETGGEHGSHNVVTSVLGEMGLLGAAALALIVYWTFVLLNAQIRHGQRGDHRVLGLALFVKATILAFFVSGLGQTMIYDRAIWILFGLALALDGVCRTRSLSNCPALPQRRQGRSTASQAVLARRLERMSHP